MSMNVGIFYQVYHWRGVMALSIEVIAAVVVPIVLGLSWLLRLEGRINLQDARYAEIKESLSYIRERLDRALNGRDH